MPSTFDGVVEVLGVAVLLSEFAMLRAALSRSQVRLYALQSVFVTVLAAYVAAADGRPDLYGVAILSLVLKVIVVPAVMSWLLRDARVETIPQPRFKVATMALIALVVAVLGIGLGATVPVHGQLLPQGEFGLSIAATLVSFLLVILRSDVVSQAVGFFSLENAISVASLVVATGLPLVMEVGFLFDLLVAVVVIGVLIRVHRRRASTLATDVLDRLRG